MERNHRETICACQGTYVAVLDSDDYWTSPDKLAKQVALMDANPDMVISFHRASMVDDLGKPIGLVIPQGEHIDATMDSLMVSDFIPSCSVMYRRSALPPFPEWYDSITTYDWPLHILTLAGGGTVGFLDEVLAAYRTHQGGAYSQLDERRRLDTEINCLRRLLETLADRQLASARFGLANKLFDLADHLRRAGDLGPARKAYRECQSLQSWGRTIPARRRLRMWLRLFVPGLAKVGNKFAKR